MVVATAAEPEITVEEELFHLELRPSAESVVIVLAGDIDLDAARQLWDLSLRALALGREAAIDWSAAGHVTTGALQVLLALGSGLRSRGLTLTVSDDNPGVRHTLELAGLSQLFPAHREHS